MTVQTAIKPAASIAPVFKPFAFKGRNSLVRATALIGVASLAFLEGKSRDDIVVQLKLALGAKPTPAEVSACALEYMVGRVAQRLTGADLPKVDMSVADRFTFARNLILHYAAPVQDGKKAKAVRRSQLGRRTVAQHKAVRASESAWSTLKADIGIGQAQTMKEKTAKARKPRTPSSGAAAPTHSELVKAPAPVDAKSAVGHIALQATSLMQYCKGHAGIVPAKYGACVNRFYAAILQLEKDVK